MTFAADYHSTIHPAGWTDFMKPVGTGPYTVASFDPGVRCLFKRFDNYWKSGWRHLDEIEQIPINDMAARNNAIRTGEVHFIEEVEPKLVAQLERVEGIDIVSAPSSAFVVTDLMCDRPPTDNLDVRLAMKYAMDRDLVVKQVFQGHAVVGNDHPVAPIWPTSAPMSRSATMTPTRRGFTGRRAGMEGRTLDFHTSNAASAGAEDMAIIFKESARGGGHGHQRGAPSHRRLLERHLDEGAGQPVGLERTPHRGSDPDHRPQERRALERDPVEERALRHVAAPGPGRARQGAAREIYCELQRLLHEEGGALLPAFTNTSTRSSTSSRAGIPIPRSACRRRVLRDRLLDV